MSTFLKFNAVGALGAVLQISSLTCLNRVFPGHYLLASSAAVELALLHNFFWHLHYTWRDRRPYQAPWRQCLRFHLSNGLVSFFGNLALMRLLVHRIHLPVPLANLVAILCCAIVNFLLAHYWAFAAVAAAPLQPPPAIRTPAAPAGLYDRRDHEIAREQVERIAY